ncbi:hypothetical protein CH333_07395 [candidate division WOR-3 bacterium JGI_Cruoil_03_44_89]|uniref:Uncharacterized protein n=1 Tax=candidate division WOR-3 bacterium JGI_Cruoil_03_44_89 TaxID=1973748 RepID=A0A235BR72_UNCW3|nr:MAG: hypothetical protein CH333_07395 [candidate division WOR-3 bacterium JGI_Cruoil_03_44_89]
MLTGRKSNLADQMRIAERMINAKRHNEAIERLRNIISKYPDWLSPHLLLSDALYERGEKEKALDVLLEVAHLEPFNLVLKKRIIRLYLECGKREPARELIKEVALLFPGDELTKSTAGELQSPFVTETMAKLYERQGYVDDARKIHEKLGKSASRKGRKSDAEKF